MTQGLALVDNLEMIGDVPVVYPRCLYRRIAAGYGDSGTTAPPSAGAVAIVAVPAVAIHGWKVKRLGVSCFGKRYFHIVINS
jgi:hypothetical protein